MFNFIFCCCSAVYVAEFGEASKKSNSQNELNIFFWPLSGWAI